MVLSEEDKLSLLEDITRIASQTQVDIKNPVLYVSGQPGRGKRLYNQFHLIDTGLEGGMMKNDNAWFVSLGLGDLCLHIVIGSNIIAPMESGVISRENDPEFITQCTNAIKMSRL